MLRIRKVPRRHGLDGKGIVVSRGWATRARNPGAWNKGRVAVRQLKAQAKLQLHNRRSPKSDKARNSRIQALSGEVAALSEAAKLSRLVTVITFQSEGLEEG